MGSTVFCNRGMLWGLQSFDVDEGFVGYGAIFSERNVLVEMRHKV